MLDVFRTADHAGQIFIPHRQTAKRRSLAFPLHYRKCLVYGPPTLCGTGHFGPAWYLQSPGYVTFACRSFNILLAKHKCYWSFLCCFNSHNSVVWGYWWGLRNSCRLQWR